MAIYHPSSVTCSCGRTFPIHVAQTLNAKRAPDVRKRILDLELHRVVCPQCHRVQAIERPMSYVDPIQNSIYFVQPRGARVGFRRDSKRLARATADLPEHLLRTKNRRARVVYGLDELREKLVAEDLKLDDRFVELLKALVLYEHPFLMRRARLQLFLTGAQDDKLRFAAYHHNNTDGYEILMPRAIVANLQSREKEIRDWSRKAHKEPLVDLPDAWVNLRRYTLRYDPLETLQTFARSVREGKDVDFKSQEFKRMLDRLPHGNQLSGSSKQDLRTLFDYAKKRKADKIEQRILEVRFGVDLDDEWALNDPPNDIDTIWQLFATVPPTNIEGNTSLREVDLTSGGGGVYYNGVIEIGESELGDRESFEDVLRHEVGHAVQEQRDAIVTPWLEQRFGWRIFKNTLKDIDEWVKLMGGWGDVRGQAKDDILQALRMAAGPGEQWGPGKPPRLPSGHAWWEPAFGPRIAYERSRADWFRSFRDWHRSGTTAFFVNYWYANFMAVSADTLDHFVARMPDDYAAMSPYEFFAEVYALYYDRDDPLRHVITGEQDVASWLDQHIGRYDPKNPRKPAQRRPARTVRRRPGRRS